MITASHNPPQDNGYKLYLGDGAQIVPPWTRRSPPTSTPSRPSPTCRCPMTASRCWASEVVDAYLDGAVAPARRRTPSDRGRVHGDARRRRRHRCGRRSPGPGSHPPHEVREQVGARPRLPHRGLPEPGGARRPRPRPRAGSILGRRPRAGQRPRRRSARHRRPRRDGELASPHRRRDRCAAGRPPAPHRSLRPRRRVRHHRRVVAPPVDAGRARRGWPTARPSPASSGWSARPVRASASRSATRRRSATAWATSSRDKDGITAALVAAGAGRPAPRRRGPRSRERLDDLARAHGAHVTRQRSIRVSGGDWIGSGHRRDGGGPSRPTDGAGGSSRRSTSRTSRVARPLPGAGRRARVDPRRRPRHRPARAAPSPS